MASKRKLKKGIQEIAYYLVDDIALLFYILDEKYHQEVEALMNRTIMMAATSTMLVSHPNGAKNEKLVREYYTDLKVKFNDEVEAIEKEIARLLECADKE